MRKSRGPERRRKRRNFGTFQVGAGVNRRSGRDRRQQLDLLVQLDRQESKRRRDTGIAQVDEPSWSARAELCFRDWRLRRCRTNACGEPFLLEEFRAYANEQIDLPHHPNCWGAFSRRMREIPLLIGLKVVDQATAVKSKSTNQEKLQLTCENCRRHENLR